MIFLAAVGHSQMVLGQVDWVKPTAEIEDAQVVIEKDKVIKLNGVSRRYEPIPIEIPTVSKVQAPYNIPKVDVALPPMKIVLRPQTMKPELLQKFFWGTIKAGFGNYTTPYFSASVGTKRSDDYSLNLQVDYLQSEKGPVDGKNSGAGFANAVLGGKYFLNNSTLSGSVSYGRNAYHFYGYDQSLTFSPDDIKQTLNKVEFMGSISGNNTDSPVDYNLDVRYNYVSDAYDVSEGDLGLTFGLSAKPVEHLDILFNVQTDFISQKDQEVAETKRRYIYAKPVVGYQWNEFKFSVGGTYVNENDSLSADKESHFFPHFGIGYKFNRSHQVNLSYSGTVERVTLRELYHDNLYLDRHISVNHNVNPVSLHLGADGSFGSRFGYKIGLQYDQFKRKGYFINSGSDSTRFDVVYDQGDSRLTQFYAQLDYTVANTFKLSGRVNSFNYNTIDIAKPWHMPKIEAILRGHLFLFDKIGTDLALFYLGGIEAPSISTGEAVSLDNVIDLNIDLSYHITPRASVFASMMNIFGREYQLYQNYPTKGFQVVAGLAYNF